MTCGIYKITSPTLRVYVGQSLDIEKRFAGYRVYSGCCRQRRLYNSLKKHGAENHEYAILEARDAHQLSERERYWQETLDSTGENGLNCRFVTTQDKTGAPSADSLARMRKAQSGKNNPNYGKYGDKNPLFGRKRPDHVRVKIKAYQQTRGRLIEQWSIDGELVKIGRFRDFVSDGFNNGNLSSCCSGRLKTTGGYVFRYHENCA
jgi:group I intron endonuclease